MSIANEISRIQTAKADIKAAIEEKELQINLLKRYLMPYEQGKELFIVYQMEAILIIAHH